jgi:hypothetical protein
MKSLSISKLLQYVDLTFLRIAELEESGNRVEARKRLRVVESILSRALLVTQRMLSSMEEQANEIDIEAFQQQLAAMPETADRD